MKLDTETQVFFYEQEFYVLSNFAAFTLMWKGIRFDTSEAAYHWEKFPHAPEIREAIRTAPSAHEAFKIAERNREYRRADWDQVKAWIMLDILRAKFDQHEYVRRKLLETGNRELIEDSWRDDFWGWGPNRDGQNMLGRIWMDIRAVIQDHELPDKRSCGCAYCHGDKPEDGVGLGCTCTAECRKDSIRRANETLSEKERGND